MMVKRSISALCVALAVIVSLSGCGGSGGSGGSAVSAGNSSSTAGNTGSTGGTSAGFAKLSWDLPQSQAGIVGFRVHYGTAPGTYTNSVNVGMTATYTITGLGPGTYYFAVTSVDSAGNESRCSNEASKTIS